MKYRKTALIEAERFGFGSLSAEFHAALCFEEHRMVAGSRDEFGVGLDIPHIHTLEGPHHVSDGDWIARGIKGEFWPIKDDIFRATYEPAPQEPTTPKEDTR